MAFAGRQPHYYRVAEQDFCIEFCDSPYNGTQLVPSFEPFEQTAGAEELSFRVCVDDSLRPYCQEELAPIGEFDSGNGLIKVDRHKSDNGYQFIFKNNNGRNCCLLQADRMFTEAKCALRGDRMARQYGLNSALMIIYQMNGGFHDTLLLHASVVRHNGIGYAFIAKSGTGKSTQVSSWLRYIENCDLVNDDTPAVRVLGGDVFIYGTPWSGKTPCYRNLKVRLGAITKIDRASANSIEKLPTARAVGFMMPACSTMMWDDVIFDNTCNTIAHIIERVGVYELHCLPDKEAAIICHKAISK